MVEGRTTVARLVTPLNALPAMKVADAGMVTEMIAVPMNAFAPMVASWLFVAKVTVVRLVAR